MAAGFYVTVQGIPGWFYTDQWWLDSADDWTGQQLVDDICAMTDCDGPTHTLEKGGVALDMAAAAAGQLANGDTVVRVEA